MKPRWLLCLLLALPPAASLADGPAAASGAFPSADLGALLREAQASNPSLLAAAARLAAARRMPPQAGAPPDPEVSISYLNDGVSRFTLGESEFSTLSLTWTQEIPHPGKLRQNGEVASLDADRVAREVERVRLEITAAVKSAYADLYRLDRTGDILDETHLVLESLAQAARRRYEVGQGIQESVLKAQTEILRLEAERARVTQDRRAAEVRLNSAVGRPADTPLGPVTLLPEGSLPGEPEALADAAVAASPEVGEAETAVRREEASLRLARLDLKPDFIWSASYQSRDGLDPMVMGSFGMRLPIYRKRKQAQGVLQTEANLVEARQELVARQVRARAMVRDLTARVQRADRLVVLFGQGVIPQARTTLESAQSSYAVGRLGFLDLLNDLTSLLTARIDLAVQEADRIQGLAALEPLLVRELIPVPAGASDKGGPHVDSR